MEDRYASATYVFQGKLNVLLENCKARGVCMKPYYTYRQPLYQAELWVSSRTIAEVNDKILKLRVRGYDAIADLLEQVNTKDTQGPWKTNAVPGKSWHQYNQAVDCYWVVDDKAEWSPKKLINGVNGYHVYREEAIKLGLHIATKTDWVHIQLQKTSPTLKEANICVKLEVDRP